MLQPGLERLQLRLSLFKRRVEAWLIAFFQWREVNRLDGRVQLPLTLGLSFFIRVNHGARGKQFRAQKSWVGASARRLDREFAAKEFRLHLVACDHPRRDQKSLPGLRVFG